MGGSDGFVVRVRVAGELGPAVAVVFDDVTITDGGDGTTTLEAAGIDQAAVHGLLDHIRDLGLSLVSVNAVVVALPASQHARR